MSVSVNVGRGWAGCSSRPRYVPGGVAGTEMAGFVAASEDAVQPVSAARPSKATKSAFLTMLLLLARGR